MTLLDLIREKSTKTDGTIVELIEAIKTSGSVYIVEQNFTKVEDKLEVGIIMNDKNSSWEIDEHELDIEANSVEHSFDSPILEVELA